MNHTFYTPAEFRSLREIVGMTRNELAERMGVEEKHIRHWEKPKSRVPREAPDTLVGILTEAKALAATFGPLPVLIRFRPTDNYCPVKDVWVWSCAINMAVVADPTKRVVWFLEVGYEAFLAESALPSTFGNLMAWAAAELPRQAIPHSSDQPPMA